MATTLFDLRDSAFRRLALRIFRRVNPGDVTIRHHWTGDPVRLHSFKHKGYWWHGKRREQETIEGFQRLIRPGDTVFEVGGHIGYLSLIYANLVGAGGRVLVFEPGANNLPYLKRNIGPLRHVELVEKAVSDTSGTVTFWLEDLSGQNNSLIQDYHLLKGNIELAGLNNAVNKQAVTVQSVTLDDFIGASRPPAFVKIDVEGAELMVLCGAAGMLECRETVLMVEVTREAEAIHALFVGAGYRLFHADRRPVSSHETMVGNVFCLPHDEAVKRFLG